MEKQPTPLFFFKKKKNKMLSEKVKITAAVPLLQVCTQRSLEILLTVTGWSIAGKSNYLYFLLSFVANRNKWLYFPLMDTQAVWSWSSFFIWTARRISAIRSSWPESWACFHLRDTQYSILWKDSFSGIFNSYFYSALKFYYPFFLAAFNDITFLNAFKIF